MKKIKMEKICSPSKNIFLRFIFFPTTSKHKFRVIFPSQISIIGLTSDPWRKGRLIWWTKLGPWNLSNLGNAAKTTTVLTPDKLTSTNCSFFFSFFAFYIIYLLLRMSSSTNLKNSKVYNHIIIRLISKTLKFITIQSFIGSKICKT